VCRGPEGDLFADDLVTRADVHQCGVCVDADKGVFLADGLSHRRDDGRRDLVEVRHDVYARPQTKSLMASRNSGEQVALDHGPSATSGEEPAPLDDVDDGLPGEASVEGVVEIARFAAGEIDEVGARNSLGELRVVGAGSIPHSYGLGLGPQRREVVDASVHPIIDHPVAFAPGRCREADDSGGRAEQAEELAIDLGHRREVFATPYDCEHELSPAAAIDGQVWSRSLSTAHGMRESCPMIIRIHRGE
jgi:hypothetical protein